MIFHITFILDDEAARREAKLASITTLARKPLASVLYPDILIEEDDTNANKKRKRKYPQVS